MSGWNYPDGIDGSHPWFNRPDYPSICADCRWCVDATNGGQKVSDACTFECGYELSVELIDGAQAACENFELR